MLRSILSSVLFILGFSFCILGLIFIIEKYQPQRLAFAQVPTGSLQKKAALPLTITVHGLDTSFPVVLSSIKNGEWETTKKGISYLTTSATPGEKGNAIFYGHNYPSLLGRLGDVAVGSFITIQNADEKKVVYEVIEKKIVDPNDLTVLSQTKDARLTLYTCTGFFDEKRLVVISRLK